MDFLRNLVAVIASFLGKLFVVAPVEPVASPTVPPDSPTPAPTPTPTPPPSAAPSQENAPAPAPAVEPNPDVLLPWIFGVSFTHNNYHNVRVLCDLEGLPFDMKEDLTATVWGESEFNTSAVCHNYKELADGTKILESTDHGIAQWNDYWHASEISPTEATNDPEKAIRLMCRYFKQGLADEWVAHKTGRYLQFKGRTL